MVLDISVLLGSGIYFLRWKGSIVYIGMSKNPLARIGSHSKGKIYDSIWFYPCPLSKVKGLESSLIYTFRPKYNDEVKDESRKAHLSEFDKESCDISYSSLEKVIERLIGLKVENNLSKVLVSLGMKPVSPSRFFLRDRRPRDRLEVLGDVRQELG
jgi:hypothetical protein